MRRSRRRIPTSRSSRGTSRTLTSTRTVRSMRRRCGSSSKGTWTQRSCTSSSSTWTRTAAAP
ncbi:unnamed protein product [Prorocentrum cordatum]|uniref:Uncharacterized protein n=1 Tax=Prorocentrum cordatum TaxID=2364126 RepID=A0ABN9QKF6_9DINO|nr:unnamed protein product [Polarella glacialis]